MLGDVIAKLAAVLTLDTVAFEKGATLAEKRFEQSRKRFEKIGKQMQSVGVKMSAAITAPLAGLGYQFREIRRYEAFALARPGRAEADHLAFACPSLIDARFELDVAQRLGELR